MSKKIILLLCLLGSFGILAATLFGHLARWVDLAEFVVSLRPLLFLTGSLLLLSSFLLKQKQAAIIVTLSLCINLIEFAPYILPSTSAPRTNLSVLFYNVDKIRMQRVSIDEVADLLDQTQPDIAVLREVGVEQAAELISAFESQYPHTLAYQHSEIDGFVILSRFPLKNTEIIQLGGGRQVGIADVEIDGKLLHLVAPHPTNALHGIEERNRQLATIADYVATAPRPLMIVGDLNVTMWSGWYKQIERAGVRNVRIGNGIMPSWKIPGAVFPGTLIYIPLDHILVSKDIGIFSAETLLSPGSDHQPLLARLKVDQ
ncbi:MAG: endonuclease/exonuclease/phosphatase (EEP) superfamily protein YafD [Cellvibrionaceae bacterium]|jgi:endonuclease/exonuclease/phosphatase (EEP) superfamily protein YafD